MSIRSGSVQTRCAAEFLTTAQLIILPDAITDEERDVFNGSVKTLDRAIEVMVALIDVYKSRHNPFSVGKRAMGRLRVHVIERVRG